jgi:hypothetical protein
VSIKLFYEKTQKRTKKYFLITHRRLVNLDVALAPDLDTVSTARGSGWVLRSFLDPIASNSAKHHRGGMAIALNPLTMPVLFDSVATVILSPNIGVG